MTEKEFIIHAGLPKTGTTSIQNYLAENAALLASHGILFPITNECARQASRKEGIGLGWHHGLSNALLGRWRNLAEGEWNRWLNAFHRFRDDESIRRMILSTETIGVKAARMNFNLIEKELGHAEFRIVVVMRSAEAWLTSLFEQAVRGKGRSQSTPEDFRPAADYINGGFADKVEALARIFPEGRIQLLAFETLLAKPGLLPTFLCAVDIPPEITAASEASKHSNTALSQDAVVLLRAANEAEISKGDYLAIRKAIRKTTVEGAPKTSRRSIFPEEMVERIHARYRADIVYFRERYGMDMARPVRMTSADDGMILSAEANAALRDTVAPVLTSGQLAAFDLAARHARAKGGPPRRLYHASHAAGSPDPNSSRQKR